jgi:hypothetical protein
MLEDAVVLHRACSIARVTLEYHGRIPRDFVHAYVHAGQEKITHDIVQVLDSELHPNILKATHAILLLNGLEGARQGNICRHALRDTGVEGLKHKGMCGVQIHLALSFLGIDGHQF